MSESLHPDTDPASASGTTEGLRWEVSQNAAILAVELDGCVLSLTRQKALALHHALNAALPHMAVQL